MTLHTLKEYPKVMWIGYYKIGVMFLQKCMEAVIKMLKKTDYTLNQ